MGESFSALTSTGFWKLLRRKALKLLSQCTVVGKEGKEEKLMSGAKEKGMV